MPIKLTDVEALDADEWLIWSEEHGRWWAVGGWGYTNSMIKAGRFPKLSADQICESANCGGNFNEVAIPAPDLKRFGL